MTWAVQAPISRPTAKLTLVCLADYASEEGVCHPSQRSLAERVGVTERALRDALQWLEAEGYLSRTERRRTDGSRTSDAYQLPPEAYRKNFPHPRKETQSSPEDTSGPTTFEPAIDPSSLRSERPEPKKSVRLSESWTLPTGWGQDAIEAGLPAHLIDLEASKMRDWSLSSPNGAKKDWRAAWRNWCRGAAEKLPRARGSPPGRAVDSLIDNLLSQMDQADGDPAAKIDRHQAPALGFSRHQ